MDAAAACDRHIVVKTRPALVYAFGIERADDLEALLLGRAVAARAELWIYVDGELGAAHQ